MPLAGPGGQEGGPVRVLPQMEECIQTLLTVIGRVSLWHHLDKQPQGHGWLWTQVPERFVNCNPSNETAHGPVTVANGALFAWSVFANGPIYTMDTNTGKILWSYNTGSTVYGGVPVGYGCIYLGNGYPVSLSKFHPTWTAGTSLYAFCTI